MRNPLYLKAIKVLRKHRVRITPQRQIILKYLINHHNHPSVYMIYKALKQRFTNLSMATVYNTLRKLESIGIIIELPGQNGGVRFDFFGNPHMHAICQNCGRIFDVPNVNYSKLEDHIKQLAKKQTGFKVNKVKIEVSGICPSCQKKLSRH